MLAVVKDRAKKGLDFGNLDLISRSLCYKD